MNTVDIIYLNIPADERAVIDKAASICGRSRIDFIMDCARSSARALLDEKRLFILSPEKWDEFVEALEKPISKNPAFQKTLATPLPWDSAND